MPKGTLPPARPIKAHDSSLGELGQEFLPLAPQAQIPAYAQAEIFVIDGE